MCMYLPRQNDRLRHGDSLRKPVKRFHPWAMLALATLAGALLANVKLVAASGAITERERFILQT